MLLIPCPYCGDRPELEFRYGGEAHIARPAFVRRRSPTRTGPSSSISAPIRRACIAERWRHIHGCARFFNAVRDTVTDKFVTTYKVGEPKPDLAPRGRIAAQPRRRAR